MPAAPSAPSAQPANALPPGTRLGEFEVLDVLGVGGFGIVYLAMDHTLEREVAIKEYMPAALAGRTATLHVSVRSLSDAETFALGLRSFVNEAKLLARFDHPSLLKVFRFWEANDTGYMAMPVYRGQTLKAVRSEMVGPPDEAWLRTLLDPLLGAIETLHSQEVFHRDIAPDNILIEPDGRPVLLDFGAARRVIGDHSQALTAILKPAYAPIEQYAEASTLRQGPWTDLYALGATLAYALTGHPPAPSTARTLVDDMQPLADQDLPGCSPRILKAIDWMLAPRPADRPQSVAALRAVLDGGAELPAPSPEALATTAAQRTRAAARSARSPTPVASGAAPVAPTVFDTSFGPDSLSAPTTDLPLEWPPSPDTPTPSGPVPVTVSRPRRPLVWATALGALVVVGAAAAWWWPGASTGDEAAVSLPADLAASASVASASSPASAASAVTETDPMPVLSPAAAERPALPLPSTVARPAVPVTADALYAPPRQPAKANPRVDTPPAAPSSTVQPGADVAPTKPSVPSARTSTTAAAPTVAASAPLSDQPEAICGRRVLLAQFICMERECRTDAFAKHPACRKWWHQNRPSQP